MGRQRMMGIVDRVEGALSELSELMADPGAVAFDEVRSEFERLEKVIGAKGYIDAAFAYAADRAGAGKYVGAVHSLDYLARALGLSRAEARSRLRRGEDLFAPPKPSPPEPEPAPEPDETEEQRRVREEEAERIRREEAERLRRQEEAQRKARDAARKAASAEKQAMITRELEHLNVHSEPSYQELLALALVESDRRSLEDLRTWLRGRIREANRRGRTPEGRPDPFAALRKRKIIIGAQDADGGAQVSMYLDAAGVAVLRAALAPGRRPGVNASVPAEEDARPMPARLVDQLMAICQGYLAADSAHTRQGVGSVAVSMTAAELEGVAGGDRFPSSTGHLLGPADILRLGAARYDLGVLHDEQGAVLHLGRTQRSASLAQRLALFAQELCCTRPGCTVGVGEADIHHIRSWLAGGGTDIENLTVLCRSHHSANRDQRDGAGGLGHMDTDPGSGRVGWCPPDGGQWEFNDTEFQQHSAGAKIRSRGHPTLFDSFV
ncbi:HNH endonuclease [Corynebacterium hylobatis]|uniref:HNH endonuclease n=1 Tax=Corynebacterium hylobatis TaxID=1859290 RepID=A0A430HYC9_9CORY|nr:HNH endonuclease signature motif containing protein [Corynebacterium hylobatis]RSZ63543.1 HNH endonuclease [Corynebacterium hylobatis]